MQLLLLPQAHQSPSVSPGHSEPVLCPDRPRRSLLSPVMSFNLTSVIFIWVLYFIKGRSGWRTQRLLSPLGNFISH